MKQLVILYSTRTGNTKKLAQGLARELEEFEPVVMERKAGEAVPQAQAYLAGYWADRGHANEEMEIFLKSLKPWAPTPMVPTPGILPRRRRTAWGRAVCCWVTFSARDRWIRRCFNV